MLSQAEKQTGKSSELHIPGRASATASQVRRLPTTVREMKGKETLLGALLKKTGLGLAEGELQWIQPLDAKSMHKLQHGRLTECRQAERRERGEGGRGAKAKTCIVTAFTRCTQQHARIRTASI